MIRRHIRARLLERTLSTATRLEVSSLDVPTVVLAPHPDDETLGSGGLIALLRDRGTPVSIVFMTDGAASHASVTGRELAELRRREAVVAAALLGVAETDLHFLDHPDGGLSRAEAAATEQIVDKLDELGASRLVLPHAFEPNADHAATFRIADRAVRQRGEPMEALTYIVWFWDQWPWTNPFAPPRGRHGRRENVDMARRGRLGFGVGRQLTHVVDISEVADRKRAALDAHASQMVRPAGRPDWLTLADVADGDWLDLLLQPHELFSATTLGGARGGDRREGFAGRR